MVAIGQAVARLAHRGEKEAVVALPESWLAEARKAKATVRLWHDRERSFTATLRELSPQADAASRTYAARFTIRDADDAVAFGMTATVTLALGSDAPVARLPLSAILNRGTGPAVYVVDAATDRWCSARSRSRRSPKTRRSSPPASATATRSSRSARRSSKPA